MSPVTEKTAGKKTTRERILERALQLVSQHGLDAVSLGELASQLQLSKSGLFAHFGSKQELQIALLRAAGARFVDIVVRPALTEPRGEPRVVALFERWMAWGRPERSAGGCIFVAAAAELDDQPGPVRDVLVELQKLWIGALKRAAELAVAEGHFGKTLDAEQFAFETYALMLGYHHHARLLHEPAAADRARSAFDSLLVRARAGDPALGSVRS